MESRGSVSHSQGLSNNPYPKANETSLVLTPISIKSILIFSSHLRLFLPKGLFAVGLSVKILNAFLPSFIVHTDVIYMQITESLYYFCNRNQHFSHMIIFRLNIESSVLIARSCFWIPCSLFPLPLCFWMHHTFSVYLSLSLGTCIHRLEVEEFPMGYI